MPGITIKALHIMKTTKKNWKYYYHILATPSYKMRHELEDEYKIIALGAGCSFEFLSMVADHLTAYNELAVAPLFFRMKNFKLN